MYTYIQVKRVKILKKYKNLETGVKKSKKTCKERHCLAPEGVINNVTVLKKCKNKFDCLLCEMFFIN